MFGSRAADTLALRNPPRRWRDVSTGFLIVAAVSGVYTLVTTLLSPEDIVRDLRPLWEIMRSEWWWVLVLVAVVGAPLSEEFLFRGFLQPALTKRLGFAGAAVVTTAAWTALHASYSAVGLGEVFLVGLVLSWLLWQTGSLWVPILCHGVYNGAIISFLAAFPVPA
jgi:membrane protease YdiL (CAAX protease family)